jgi:hypothetical protein
MLKSSHFRTPRTLSEGTFVTGYRPAERPHFAELGHWLLNIVCVVGLVVLVPLVVIGVV